MSPQRCARLLSTLLAALFLGVLPASARIGLVVGEPFGSFGTMMPVGHAGIFLDKLCAETPTHLRPCQPGEAGVVLSRYHDLRATNADWLAFPTLPFFYGVENAADTPESMTPALEAELRESYRRAYLTAAVPDRFDKKGRAVLPANGDWAEGIGSAFDRRLLLYVIDTTPEQDAAILAMLNGDPNRRQYTLRRRNCADFAAGILNVVLPGVIHRNVLGDFNLMTPKQIARTLDRYGAQHPELHLGVYEIPQIPGTLRRSRPLRGSAETFVKTKRYLFTLLAIQPEALLLDWIDYEAKDKWKPGTDAVLLSPADWKSPASPAYSPLSTASSTASDATIGLRAK